MCSGPVFGTSTSTQGGSLTRPPTASETLSGKTVQIGGDCVEALKRRVPTEPTIATVVKRLRRTSTDEQAPSDGPIATGTTSFRRGGSSRCLSSKQSSNYTKIQFPPVVSRKHPSKQRTLWKRWLGTSSSSENRNGIRLGSFSWSYAHGARCSKTNQSTYNW